MWWDAINLRRWFRVAGCSSAREQHYYEQLFYTPVMKYYWHGPQSLIQKQLWISRSHDEVVIPWRLVQANLDRVRLRLF